jgi:beta-lactamase regulating signal transducer with metallopeptidase domain
MNLLLDTLNLWGPRFAGLAVRTLAQSSLLILLLVALEMVLRHRVRATVRHGLWLLVLVKLMLPTWLTSPTSIAYWLTAPAPGAPVVATLAPPPTPSIEPNEIAGQRGHAQSLVAPGANPVPPARALTWAGLGLLVWLAGVVALASAVGWRWVSVRRMLSRGTAAPGELTALLESCRRQMRVRTRVELRCNNALGSPSISGFFRPVITVPVNLVSELTSAGLRSVLLHELAHLKRGDLWVRHLQVLLQICYWYNPLLWFANALIRRVREEAVDEMVLVEMREESAEYPQTLLRVARLLVERPVVGLGMLGIVESPSALGRRIRRMVGRPAPRSATVGVGGLLLVALVGLLALPMGTPRRSAAAETPRPVGPAIDPATGLPLPAQTGSAPQTAGIPAIDPATGLPLPPRPAGAGQTTRLAGPAIDPTTGLPLPAAGGQPARPRAPMPINPATGLPVVPPAYMFPKNFVPPNQFVAGWALSPEEVQRLEAGLLSAPGDLATREQLIGYYQRAQPFSPQARAARALHVLWVIQHHPEAYTSAFETLNRYQDGEAFGQAGVLWLKQLRASPGNAVLLLHAAGYAPLPDGETAEDLLTRAQALQPANPEVLKGLASVYASQALPATARGQGAPADKALMQKALGLMERAQAATTDPQSALRNLPELAQMAFDAGDFARAQAYAGAIFTQSAQLESANQGLHLSFQRERHQGHLLLGRIALAQGDVAEAKKQLLEAANITSDDAPAPLSSFGPNMLLAKELLANAEKDTVLEYFRRCRRFWSGSMAKEKLDAWSWQVSQGEAPDFGANLLY